MLHIYKKAYPYYGKIYGILIFCLTLRLVQSVLMLVEPQVISLMVDKVVNPALGKEAVDNSSIFNFVIADYAPTDYWGMFQALAVVLLGFVFLYLITHWVNWNVAHYFSIKCDNKLRSDVIKKIHSFGPDILKEYNGGDLITIINSDCEKVRLFHAETMTFIVDEIFYIIIALYFLSRISLTLVLIPFISAGVLVYISKGMTKLFDELYDGIRERTTVLNTEAQESIYGIRTIKACGREDVRQKRFYQRSEDVRDYTSTFGVRKAKYLFGFGTTDRVVMVLSMIVSIYLATKFKMTSGEYSSFLIYLSFICDRFADTILDTADTRDQRVSVGRLFGLLDKPNPVLASYGDRKLPDKPHIEVKHLTVYSGDKKLVNDVNLDIPYGKKLGIMGCTGCGKSILLKVLQAFKEYQEGELLINDIPSHEYSRDEIARAYGYAMQDVFLFSNTIAANIAYYSPDVSKEEIELYGSIACVEEFVSKFPDGYDTVIGEKGFGLSGGQKQRVAIARALLKNAPITILDDCTSALDMETESQIFKNLEAHFKEKTLIMATHRASALKDFDEIIFMDDGKIIERGTFYELMKLNGAYAEIYNQQMERERYIDG